MIRDWINLTSSSSWTGLNPRTNTTWSSKKPLEENCSTESFPKENSLNWTLAPPSELFFRVFSIFIITTSCIEISNQRTFCIELQRPSELKLRKDDKVLFYFLESKGEESDLIMHLNLYLIILRISTLPFLISHSANVVLVDFGIAKHLDSDDEVLTNVCGSAGYTAPEILSKKGHGKPVDMWSLGVITYTM